MQIFEEIDSTQLEAKRQIDINGCVNDTILAITQTAGLTTKVGVPWIAQRGDLLYSIVLNMDLLQKKGHILINHLTFCASMAIFDFLKQTNSTLQLFFKWPNDLLVLQQKTQEYKKICGILAESYKGHFIIGIGCNLVSFPEQTTNFKATSIQNEVGIHIDNIKMANIVLKKMHQNIQQVQQFGFSSLKNKWKQHAYMLGHKFLLRDGGIVTFIDIQDEGFLVAQNESNDTLIITSDEIIAKPYKPYK